MKDDHSTQTLMVPPLKKTTKAKSTKNKILAASDPNNIGIEYKGLFDQLNAAFLSMESKTTCFRIDNYVSLIPDIYDTYESSQQKFKTIGIHWVVLFSRNETTNCLKLDFELVCDHQTKSRFRISEVNQTKRNSNPTFEWILLFVSSAIEIHPSFLTRRFMYSIISFVKCLNLFRKVALKHKNISTTLSYVRRVPVDEKFESLLLESYGNNEIIDSKNIKISLSS